MGRNAINPLKEEEELRELFNNWTPEEVEKALDTIATKRLESSVSSRLTVVFRGEVMSLESKITVEVVKDLHGRLFYTKTAEPIAGPPGPPPGPSSEAITPASLLLPSGAKQTFGSKGSKK